MSKKTKIVSLAIIIIVISFFGYREIISSEQIIARVNGKSIYQSEITKEYYNMIDKENQPNLAFDKLDDNMKYNVVKSIILGDLLEKKAIDANVDDDADYKKALVNMIKELRQKIFLDNLIAQNITEAAIGDEYKKLLETTKDNEEIKIEQLLFEKEEDANNAYILASKNTSFDKIKTDFDKQSISVKLESLDYFSNGEMMKEFENICFGLKISEISKPFKTDFGWHIVKLLDKRKKAVQPLSEVQDAIRSNLTEAFISKYIDDIIKQNSVEILVEKKDAEQK